MELHRHITCVAAPAVWLSPPSGQLTGGVDGLYVADRRVLSRLVVTLDGAEPEPMEATLHGANGARFVASAGALHVERLRTATPNGGTERIDVHNHGSDQVTATLAITASADLAPISAIRMADTNDPENENPPQTHPRPPWGADPTSIVKPAGGERGAERDSVDNPEERGESPGAAPAFQDGEERVAADGYRVRFSGRTSVRLALDPGESFTTTLTVSADPPVAAGWRPAPPASPPPWSRRLLAIRSADQRLDALVRQGVADLGALLLAEGEDLYCAAGSPWYLTLFGRDALWTARLALPLGHELAAGTLRALARHQGTRHDAATEEAPGKIPHELRPAYATTWLPPVYYGTIDATPLFVITLAEAWRWGMPEPQVADLLPAVRRALDWLGAFEDFVAYEGSAATLVNQGWKDSPDAIQYADGRSAAPPIALSEVQAYAYQAAMLGAELLDAFGEEGGVRWRDWAAELAERFRRRFWVDGYPAIALDGHGRPVDGAASNLGHLLATGLLTPAEEERVAGTLAGLDSGWGLRTLTRRSAGFDALSYHRGSVWPHDTAIAILGLARSGHREIAARLADGLISAAPWFEYRLPELYGGEATERPVPYPSACRPQAWSAAASPALVTALLGLDVDVPAGTVRLSPIPGFGELSAEGIRIGSASASIRVDASGTTSATLPPGLRILT